MRPTPVIFVSLSPISLFNSIYYRLSYFHTSYSVSNFNACTASDSPEDSLRIYQLMHHRGVHLDPFSTSFVIKSCCRCLFLSFSQQVHALMFKYGHRSDNILQTSLMGLYSGCGQFHDAHRLFDEMLQRDTISWNVLITCYITQGRYLDALRLFAVMTHQSSGANPDNVTCLLLIQASTRLGALHFGEKIHCYIQNRGTVLSENICNSLISMYSRCGCLHKAYKMFTNMPRRNVVSWSAMISGFAMNGCGNEAIHTFGEMQRAGVLPDAQTFTGVLSACSHSGLVDEGLDIFKQMKQKFNLVPNDHHYGCMVDLYGRAGRIDKAYELIASMQITDPQTWRTLLGACRIHRHMTLGECAMRNLIELKAEEPGDYVLLLNIYSSYGLWARVVELRKRMKERKILTTRSSSMIELNGEIHVFLVDDMVHPEREKIYDVLEKVNERLEAAGYVADASSELHCLDVRAKAGRLTSHSEKLAIAFGLLTTPTGMAIRVMKDLRICIDCHNFAKVLSSVYDREVVIRDRNRFHHFRRGHCSCKDYW